MNKIQDQSKLKTRTGTIHFNNKNGIVVKEIDDDISAVEKEYNNLEALFKQYQDKSFNDWTYRAAKPYYLNKENRAITMEKVTGKPLNISMQKEPSTTYHAGVWLGLFHEGQERNSTNLVSLFSDYSAPHIIVDQEIKTVCAIDPGEGFGKKGFPETDLLSFIVGVITLALKKGRNPHVYVKPFLNGYKKATGRSIDNLNGMEALNIVLEKYQRRWQKRNVIKRAIAKLYVVFLRSYCKKFIGIDR